MENIDSIYLIDGFLLSGEQSVVDYKKENYRLGDNPKKTEIIKDIIAMANSLNSDIDFRYIIVGYDEVEKKVVSFESEDQSNFQQYINCNVSPGIHFEYLEIEVKLGKVGVFIIRGSNFNNQPFLLQKELKFGVKHNLQSKGTGFIRVGTTSEIINKIHLDSIYEKKYNRDRSNDLNLSLINENNLAIVLRNISKEQLFINNCSIKIFDYINQEFIKVPFNAKVNNGNIEIFNLRNIELIINPNSEKVIFSFRKEFQNDLLKSRNQLKIEVKVESPNFINGPKILSEIIQLNK